METILSVILVSFAAIILLSVCGIIKANFTKKPSKASYEGNLAFMEDDNFSKRKQKQPKPVSKPRKMQMEGTVNLKNRLNADAVPIEDLYNDESESDHVIEEEFRSQDNRYTDHLKRRSGFFRNNF